MGLGGEGAANAEFLGNSDRSRKFLSRHLSASGGLSSLLSNRICGTAALYPILLFFPASVSLSQVSSSFLTRTLIPALSLAPLLEISVVDCVGTVTLHALPRFFRTGRSEGSSKSRLPFTEM